MVSVKDTNYSIPSGACFVSPSGNDANSGTKSSPWRTLGKAMSSAPNGATLVLRGGTYREGNLRAFKRLTLQPYPHEQVWLKGSLVVTGWVADGTVWRKDNWTYKFTPISADSPELDPEYPEAGYFEQVFVNGKSLAQVLSQSELGPGKFYLNRGSNQLYIGENPTGKTIEVTAFDVGIYEYTEDGFEIKGLGFSHYATRGIQLNVKNGVVENNTFTQIANRGLALNGTNARVRGNSFISNGCAGMNASSAHHSVIENNLFSRNNTENFSSSSASGVKVTKTDSIIIRNNVAEYNIRGIWLDISCINATVVGNIVRHNEDTGIFFEISHRAIIASNLVHHNGGTGISVHNSTSTRVFNNTLSKNAINLGVSDTSRKNSNSAQYAAGVTWETKDVVLKNNLLANTEGTVAGFGALMLVVDAAGAPVTGRQLVTGLNYNGYYRTSSSSPADLIRYKPSPTLPPNHPVRFNTIADFHAKYSAFEGNALAVDNVANGFFVDEPKDNYRLKSGSSAIGRGEPLPNDIASAIGVQPGVKVNLGALDPAGPSAGALG